MATIGHNGVRLTTGEGDRLSAADLEDLAREAEAGYDLAPARRRRLGRPSLDSGRSPRLSFRASRGLYEAARARAAREGRSVSALVREATERYVAE
jgi:hypothetical protein